MTVYSFSEIQERCSRLGISQKELCRVADVNETTFSKAKTKDREPTERTRRKLSRALVTIANERGVAVLEEAHADEPKGTLQ